MAAGLALPVRRAASSRGGQEGDGGLKRRQSLATPGMTRAGHTTTTWESWGLRFGPHEDRTMRFSPRVSFQELPGIAGVSARHPLLVPLLRTRPDAPEERDRQPSGVTGDGETRTRTGEPRFSVRRSKLSRWPMFSVCGFVAVLWELPAPRAQTWTRG